MNLKPLGDRVIIKQDEAEEKTSSGLYIAGDAKEKVRAIELLDSEVFVPLCKGLAALGDYRLLFLSDHYTPISTRTHDGTPVPYLLYDSRVDTGNGQPYSEAGAAASGARMEEGTDLMPLLFAR